MDKRQNDCLLIFFFRLGYPCPMNFNPADYFVNTLAIVPEEEEDSKNRVKVRIYEEVALGITTSVTFHNVISMHLTTELLT